MGWNSESESFEIYKKALEKILVPFYLKDKVVVLLQNREGMMQFPR